MKKDIYDRIGAKMVKAISIFDKLERQDAMDALKDEPGLIQKSKKDILEKLKICHESTTEASLYRGLIAVGLDGATSDFFFFFAEEIH